MPLSLGFSIIGLVGLIVVLVFMHLLNLSHTSSSLQNGEEIPGEFSILYKDGERQYLHHVVSNVKLKDNLSFEGYCKTCEKRSRFAYTNIQCIITNTDNKISHDFIAMIKKKRSNAFLSNL